MTGERRGFRWAALRLVLASAVLVSSPAAPARAAPLAAFGRLPTVSHVTISPDGNRVALIVGGEQDRQLQIRSIKDLTPIRLMRIGSAKLRALQWAGPDHLLVTASTAATVWGLSGPKREYWMVGDYNVVTGQTRRLLEGIDNAMNVVADTPATAIIDGVPHAFLSGWSFPQSRSVLTLYDVNLKNGATRTALVTNENTSDLVLDSAGTVLARVDYRTATGEWTLWGKTRTGWIKTHSEKDLLDRPWIAGIGPDGKSVYVGVRDDGRNRFRAAPLAGGDWSPPVAALDDTDPIVDPRSRTIIGGVVEDEISVRHVFSDPVDQRKWSAVERAFPGEAVNLESWSDDRSKIVLYVEGSVHGAAFFLLDLTAKRADWIADAYADIRPDDLGEVRLLHYKAQDGLDIPAYLTLPHGAAATKLPLVVLVHGGPAARDHNGFDWWAQGLASLGYAVLQPQYRGSDGFGVAFLEAGFGQWGRKMQTDLSDGVRSLADQGIVDPARVCIVGGSYGGYAAMAGVSVQSGVYRCAVSLAGPSDLRRMLNWETQVEGGTRNETMRYWQRFMGAAKAGDAALDQLSPARLAARVTVPLLLIHGLDDTVVPFDQSRAMANAMKQAGRPVDLVTLKDEDHWLSRPATRMQMLQTTADFLKINLPAAAPAAAAAGSH